MQSTRRACLWDFPKLVFIQFLETSNATSYYNCIAWAAGEDDRWWWPSPAAYWPPEVPRVETLEAFIAAFATLGYEPCADGSLEPGFEKVVIYSQGNVPKHMARQLETGKWTSKLGRDIDIEHGLPEGLASRAYGTIAQYLKRKRSK